jgi:arginase
MGAGPLRLLDAGVVARLEAAGHDVDVDLVETTANEWLAEIGAAFDLAKQIATLVRKAIAAGSFPLVLSGNCGPAAWGCAAGVGNLSQVFWFDAHGDFNTPDTTLGGFLDGMALATLTGRCWRALTATIDGFGPIREEAVTLIGARDLDPGEALALAQSPVRRLGLSAGTAAVVEGVRPRGLCYVHLDLDVLDSTQGRANSYAAAGGPTLALVQAAVAVIRDRAGIAAASVTALDPAEDPAGRAVASALALCISLASGQTST